MLPYSAIFYRNWFLDFDGSSQTILFCNVSLSKPEEDHKTVIETLQNKICLRTTVKVQEPIPIESSEGHA